MYEIPGLETHHHCVTHCQVAQIQTRQSFAAEGSPEEAASVGEAVVPAFDPENSTGVAFDTAEEEVYVDNETSVATFTAEGVPVQRFGSPQLKGGTGIAVDASNGAVYVASPSQADVGVFVPIPPHAPVVTHEGVSNLNAEAGSAKLEAKVNPFGAETEYDFEYGTSTSYEHTVPIPDAALGSSGFKAEAASVEVSGLATGTTYHFRVVAKNEHGTVFGPDHTFKLFVTAAQAGLSRRTPVELVPRARNSARAS